MTAARYCAPAWSRAASAARCLCSRAPASNSVWVSEAPTSQNPVPVLNRSSAAQRGASPRSGNGELRQHVGNRHAGLRRGEVQVLLGLPDIRPLLNELGGQADRQLPGGVSSSSRKVSCGSSEGKRPAARSGHRASALIAFAAEPASRRFAPRPLVGSTHRDCSLYPGSADRFTFSVSWCCSSSMRWVAAICPRRLASWIAVTTTLLLRVRYVASSWKRVLSSCARAASTARRVPRRYPACSSR